MEKIFEIELSEAEKAQLANTVASVRRTVDETRLVAA
jgi:hypothetical protein